MKKIIGFVVVFIGICIIYTNNVYADMGPKPSITITLKNVKSNDYDIDLLVKGLNDENIPLIKRSKKLTELESKLFEYNEDGWKAEAIRSTILWKSRSKENNNVWNFTYLGVPNHFKVIIVYKDGTISVSKEIHKNSFDYDITIDANNMEVTENSISDIRRIITIPLITTILCELIIALFFVSKKTMNIITIIITNILTNIPLQMLLLFWGEVFSEISIVLYLISFVILECTVIFIERMIYLKYIKETPKDKIKKYVILSNIISGLLTFVNIGTQIK